MSMWQSFISQAHWVWIAIGILLCAAEMVVAGVFLIWIGLAAIATGLLLAFVPMSATFSLVVFAVLAVGSVLAGWKIYGSREDSSDAPFLNRRADAMIGKTYILAEPVRNGEGRLAINDTSWRLRGPDMPAGTRIRVTGVEDAVVLLVEQD
ncbi:MAG: NfeD family protein [Beijerinckiaceae bacterium]